MQLLVEMERIEAFYNVLVTGHSPMVDEWFLMKNPLPVFGIIAAYLYFVLHAGPKMMETRKPLQIKNLLIFYNFTQVIFSVALCYMVCTSNFFLFAATTHFYATERPTRRSTHMLLTIIV